jgi:serine/threonine protein kinase
MEAHVRCSSLGFAPTLKGFERIPGGWYIVVMDFIEDEYHNLETSPDKASFESEVRVSVESLHEAGFVHGDIRSANIMVKKDGSPGIMILDFDWAGLAGQVKYPMGVNDIDIRRPNGAQDNEFIMVEHDIEMLNYMF